MTKIISLIDGHALAYRAYFALTLSSSYQGTRGSWVTSKGEPTAGVFGFSSILLRILEQENTDYLAVAFDTGRTFRHELYPEYKATRAKMPDELRPQIDRIRELVDAFNIPRLEIDNYEADDVLGSSARWAVENGLGVKIYTGDRDLLQLVSQRVIVNLPGKSLSDSKDYLPEDVYQTLGVRPEQVVDLKALMGDNSDNIPGVPGVGEKTALALLKTYEHLDNIYLHLDELKPALRKKLEDGKELAYLSRSLATIVTDLNVQLDLEQAKPRHFEIERVEALFRELEFRSLLKRMHEWLERKQSQTSATVSPQWSPSDVSQQLALFSDHTDIEVSSVQMAESSADQTQVSANLSSPSSKAEPMKVHIVQSKEELQELAARCKAASVLAFDTETTSTDPMKAELVGISLALEPGEGYYLPVSHSKESLGKGVNLSIEQIRDALTSAMTDQRVLKLGHNLKYDYIMLARYGLKVTPLSFDTMLAEWMINPDSHNLGLKKLAWVRLNKEMTDIETLIGKGKQQQTMNNVPLEAAAAYAVADVDAVLQLYPVLQAELTHPQVPKKGAVVVQEKKSSPLSSLFHLVEMPLISILAEMEMRGVLLDVEFLSQMSKELTQRMKTIEDEVIHIVGTPFNLNSSQQLSHALFDILGLKIPGRTKRTASGTISTAADVLEALRGQHQVIDLILEYREISKLKSTYVDALPQQINPATGRIHTSYSQTGSVTGRLASSEPNLQNIPIRTPLGRQVRKAFIAAHNHHLLSVDYSQIELRIVAHFAQDEAMLAAFHANQDIHAATAAAIYNVPIEEVTKEQRRHAKAINFGLIYGMSPFGLTRTSDLTLAEAEAFVSEYFKRFPGIKAYLFNMRQQAAQQGFVETLCGRRRYFPTLKPSNNPNYLSREEREAINAPIQGTAADIIKIAMLRVDEAIKKNNLQAKMLLQVHDELVFEVPDDELKNTVPLIKEVMEHAYVLSVPLVTEARTGKNWGEMEVVL